MSDGDTTKRGVSAGSRLLQAIGLVGSLSIPAPALAQAVDCSALRARIDAGGQAADANQTALAIRQNRAELGRVRAYADESGCTQGLMVDDPDPPECHALARRAEELQREIARLEADAPPDDDEDRRAAIEAYNASCTGAGPDATLPTPDAAAPADPDAPAAPAEAPAPSNRVARVFCVRHCDGAYYPLAVDVPTDRLDGLNRICQAQCPGAESSAFSGAADDDIAQARGSDGGTYASLPAAFGFQRAVSPTCACRAPGESWAQTLAKAEAMVDAHPGDVVVTPEIQSRMMLPRPAAEAKAAAARPVPPKARAKRAKTPPAPSAAPAGAETTNPGAELTREFRRSVPTL